MGGPTATHDRLGGIFRIGGWGACLLTTLIFLGFKQYSYRYVAGDENIYYYMAKIMSEGKAWPYRDFFFAHPPVQLFVAAAAFKLFGATYEVARSLPILSAVASGLALFLIAKNRFGWSAAVVSQAAFLLSYGVLRNSSHYTGANLSLSLSLWGFYLLIRGRDLMGGVVLALAAHTTVYAVPGVMMMTAWRILESPRGGLRAAVAAIGTYGLVTLGMLLLGGGQYVEGVFTYHLSKQPSVAGERAAVFLRVFRFHNFYLSWGAIVSLGALIWWRRSPNRLFPVPAAVNGDGVSDASVDRGGRSCRQAARRQRNRRSAGAGGRAARFLRSGPAFALGLLLYAGAYGFWLMRLREFYDFYFMVLFAPLALLFGFLAGETVAGLTALVRQRVVLPCVRSAMLLGLLGAGYGLVRTSQMEEFFSDRGPQNPPRAQDYTWTDASSLGPLNAAYRAAFWRDRREPDHWYPGQTYYLWHEMRHMEELGGAVDFVRANSEPADMIFGESGLAPLVAFLADRDIAGHEADTNTKRFTSGQTTVQALLDKVDGPELRIVVASESGRGYRYVNRLAKGWLDLEFHPAYRFRSASNPGTTWFVMLRNAR